MDKLTLTNGLEFVVLSKLKLDNEKYLYLSSFNTEEIHFIFAKVLKNHEIEPVEDGETIVKLMEIISKKTK